MKTAPPAKLTRALAKMCMRCPVCRRARKHQRGMAYKLVQNVEQHVCPCCRAYKRLTGRSAHEPVG